MNHTIQTMKKTLWYALVVASLLACACDDSDPHAGEADTSTPGDVSTPDDTTTPNDATTATDTTVADTACGLADGCSEDTVEADTADLTPPPDPVPPQPGELLIEEFFYSGSPPAGGADHYFSDQFVELVNATDHPLDLSGVMVADVHGAAGEINPGMTPDSYATSHPDLVVMSSVWRVPAGTRLEPGARLIIAHDGTNHRPFSTIDLSAADFEAFVVDSPRDEDSPTVANLESVVYNGGFDWLMTVFGPSLVVLRADATLGSVPGPFGDLPTAPVTDVLDAIETLMDGESGAFKRLPASLDSGFAYVSGTYVGESLHRVQEGGVFQDTNDSGADFTVGAPDPRRATEPDPVIGEAALELGTGIREFVALSNGDDIELVAGFQGGWHVDAAVRVRGFGPEGVWLEYEALDAQGQSVSYETETLLEAAGVIQDDEGWVRVGDRIVFDIISADDVVGSTLTLRVTARLGGESWTDERQLTVVDEE